MNTQNFKLNYFATTAIAIALLSSCASTEQSIVDSGGEKLSSAEIRQAFSGVREDYVAQDVPGVTAVAEWRSNGDFKADWKSNTHSGTVSGNWYAKEDKRCIRFSEKAPGGPELECVTIYRTGDTYTSINPDGSIHGVHTLSAL